MVAEESSLVFLPQSAPLAPGVEHMALVQQPVQHRQGSVRRFVGLRLTKATPEYSPDQEVCFSQEHPPGREAKIDFTHGISLGITFASQPHPETLAPSPPRRSPVHPASPLPLRPPAHLLRPPPSSLKERLFPDGRPVIHTPPWVIHGWRRSGGHGMRGFAGLFGLWGCFRLFIGMLLLDFVVRIGGATVTGFVTPHQVQHNPDCLRPTKVIGL